jgi:hypothetical protein
MIYSYTPSMYIVVTYHKAKDGAGLSGYQAKLYNRRNWWFRRQLATYFATTTARDAINGVKKEWLDKQNEKPYCYTERWNGVDDRNDKIQTG